MKFIYILSLLCSAVSFAQVTIEKTDGTKITTGEIRFNFENQKLIYKTGEERQKLKFREIKSVVSDKFIFRSFKEGKKFKGYFVKAETAGKTLAFVSYMPSAGSTTGFRPVVNRLVVAVFDNQGKLLQEMELKEGQSKKSIQHRRDAIEMINNHFADCPKLIQDISAAITKEDSLNMQIAYYFQVNTGFIPCE